MVWGKKKVKKQRIKELAVCSRCFWGHMHKHTHTHTHSLARRSKRGLIHSGEECRLFKFQSVLTTGVLTGKAPVYLLQPHTMIEYLSFSLHPCPLSFIVKANMCMHCTNTAWPQNIEFNRISLVKHPRSIVVLFFLFFYTQYCKYMDSFRNKKNQFKGNYFL